jgi:hypothetical protein
MGASKDAPKVSHTWAEILTRYGRQHQIPEDYEPEPLYAYLWNLFWEFSNRRKMSDGAPFAIEYAEILGYMQCTGEFLLPVEVHLITAMDDAFREEFAKVRDLQRSFNNGASSGDKGSKGKPRKF